MSTNSSTTESIPNTQTEIVTRDRDDPWTVSDSTSPSAHSQRQFEPTARSRLKNLTDGENAYCR